MLSVSFACLQADKISLAKFDNSARLEIFGKITERISQLDYFQSSISPSMLISIFSWSGEVLSVTVMVC